MPQMFPNNWIIMFMLLTLYMITYYIVFFYYYDNKIFINKINKKMHMYMTIKW
uniref:ATP synthase F0 subunit 8 n=1 Tax=Ecnomus sp. XG-2021 TaxID=2996734 RepID=A0A9E8LNU1_9NEOP|nr:ATP synthase F0 subunit 8 [Ecnomus sp. XG-2021]